MLKKFPWKKSKLRDEKQERKDQKNKGPVLEIQHTNNRSSRERKERDQKDRIIDEKEPNVSEVKDLDFQSQKAH